MSTIVPERGAIVVLGVGVLGVKVAIEVTCTPSTVT